MQAKGSEGVEYPVDFTGTGYFVLPEKIESYFQDGIHVYILYIYMFLYMYMYMYMCMCMCMCLCLCKYVNMFVCMYVCMYVCIAEKFSVFLRFFCASASFFGGCYELLGFNTNQNETSIR